MKREVQNRDVEERNCPRTGADIEEQKIGTEEEKRIETKNEIRTNQKDSHIRRK